MKNRKLVIWLTGLPASGKTTIGKALFKELEESGYKTHYLDGDEVRALLNEQLGFSRADRDKNIKLAIELAKKYQDKNFIVIASFITPYQHHREWARNKLDNYIEIFLDAPLEICEKRDPKGMYKKARAGGIEFFTGVSDIYEKPINPDIILKTGEKPVEECILRIMKYLEDRGL